MTIKITNKTDVTIVGLEGSLDTTTSPEVMDQLSSLLEEGRKNVIIDLAKLDYISSSGLRVLLAISKKLKPLNGTLKICGLNEVVNEVFEISGFTMIFDIYKTLEEIA